LNATNEKTVVLIAEDNPTDIASLVGILGGACELVIAKNLEQAKRCLGPEIDVILLDFYLPDGKGIELLKYVQSKAPYREVPVICTSASDQVMDIEDAFREGAIDYVLKPFNKTILSAKVSTFANLKRKNDLLASQALEDPLTGVGNRRLFEQKLDIEWRRAQREGLSVGIVLVDIDNFKLVNDRHGHAQGDDCLRMLAKTMNTTFSRAGDIVARLGGDEFAAILPGAGLRHAVDAAQRLKREALVEHDILGGTEQECPSFTISIGCSAVVPEGATTSAELLNRADANLYEAKAQGGVTVSGRKSDLATMYSRSVGATIKPRVMVVDDEPTNIRILTEALQQDYDVIIATSAGEAFRVLESGERPHLLLLDIMMPDMDGLEMCLVLKGRQELQHIPVIFITALSDVASEERGFEVGAVDYIHKPISIPSVRARVRTHISLQGMLDHLLELNKTLDEKLHQLDQLNWRLRQQQGKLGRAEASRDLFERVFMTTSEGIAVLDERGHVIAVNSSFTRITGYREEEVLGHYYEMLDGHADQNQQQRILDHLAEHDHWLGERFNRRKSGEVFSELRSISTIRSDEGYIVH
tara:strand:- start:1467 stop:3221 length:1755 start_codon:yes stop_codon:yes gene_type:complete